jgi:arginase
VLDAALMPAVDSPAPGGVDFEELSALLRQLLSSRSAVGTHVTVFDPDLDEDGALATQLADSLSAALRP